MDCKAHRAALPYTDCTRERRADSRGCKWAYKGAAAPGTSPEVDSRTEPGLRAADRCQDNIPELDRAPDKGMGSREAADHSTDYK